MLFLVLSIICSVTVGVLFKMVRGYEVSPIQIVAWNYVFALILCYFFFSPNLTNIGTLAPWGIYVSLGVLLPAIFLFLAASIKQVGIVKTDAAQRLSLFIPILAAWLVFKEDFTILKIAALLAAFPALLLILAKPSENTKNKWIYPAVVLLGFGIIDILFKQIALHTTLPYTTSLFVVFGIALFIMIGAVIYNVMITKVSLNFKNIIFGGMVGIFNFGNILFYLKAHKAFAENPSTVFAGMNMGVIVMGSLVGIFIFKEKLTKMNFAGLFLALIAIVLIVISQII
ncbi:EamA/RhaT family transporter [Flavobacterium bomense]|uniref:EamA/RhaT family transporter n=1 Tax=Flavobacterium bomense TaxID=2497483 RepID=A0A432CM51_9FLAO|nr:MULTISPECIES: EamA family transporter [Flavobacterium]RTY69506.1 EamA/RhaT family transporter [Flavobacterium sp. LB2P53]RTZ02963.1 EamA/RhaT family transporter [Flavobacterium sp. GSP6]RTZ04556.1 EamA/RhaT family transporter [Flavobacterium bomense]